MYPLDSKCYCEQIPDPQNSHVLREMTHQVSLSFIYWWSLAMSWSCSSRKFHDMLHYIVTFLDLLLPTCSFMILWLGSAGFQTSHFHKSTCWKLCQFSPAFRRTQMLMNWIQQQIENGAHQWSVTRIRKRMLLHRTIRGQRRTAKWLILMRRGAGARQRKSHAYQAMRNTLCPLQGTY